MNFDYIRMLTYMEINDFITKVLAKNLKTNVLVKLTNVKTDSCAQELEFEAVASNGAHIVGKAVCSNFECEISIKQAENKAKLNPSKDWAKYVHNIISQKETLVDTKKIMSRNFKLDYNEYCMKVRDAKRAEADQEFEASLLK